MDDFVDRMFRAGLIAGESRPGMERELRSGSRERESHRRKDQAEFHE